MEINDSFYSLPRPKSYRAWYEATPEGFVFSIKGSRFITHMERASTRCGAPKNIDLDEGETLVTVRFHDPSGQFLAPM